MVGIYSSVVFVISCRDINVQVEEEWLQERNSSNDRDVLNSFVKQLSASPKQREL